MESYADYRKLAFIAAHRALGKNKSHLDDCVQVGLSAMYMARDSFDKSRNTKLETFLYRCAYNRIMNYIRDNKIWKEKEARSQARYGTEPAYHNVAWFELLDSLNDFEKTIFQQFYVDKMKKVSLIKVHKLDYKRIDSILKSIRTKLYNDLIK